MDPNKCNNCKLEGVLCYDSKHYVVACKNCGLVNDETTFSTGIKFDGENTTVNTYTPSIQTICTKMNTILAECLPLFGIHHNVAKTIKKKMTKILKSNKELGRFKNVESVVFILLIHAVRELKIPLNKSKINAQIQLYVSMNAILKDMKNVKL
uniref:Uncharacterized protein n=1 Tax=Pyramimonas orientalis virus TaxID=455367 RepID=A0A7M3UNP6_POV01|nr:hypothetical protein HWQ62_00184 [Pyramimonas orientalis virus]